MQSLLGQSEIGEKAQQGQSEIGEKAQQGHAGPILDTAKSAGPRLVL